MSPPEILRIGNVSGFYGDRFSAVREMLEGGPIDVLTGDYLAELTMLILGRARAKNPSQGYARTFLGQMEESLGLALAKGVKIVVNAGGLAPEALAHELRGLSERLGISARIAHVEGDDLLLRAHEFGFGEPLSANAYLGAFGIATCLREGADVVVTGRVTDASLVVGAAIAHFGWAKDDWNALAGATAAGHLLECGTQVTGGNYAFFTEIDVLRPGFPIAEMSADGSSVITKHPGTGGHIDKSVVTAQLLYEIAGPRYLGPDVTTRFDTIQLSDQGKNRVRVTGVVGEPPPPTTKVCLYQRGGYENELTFILTGLDIPAKAELIRRQLELALPRLPSEMHWDLARTDQPDAATEQTASALLRVTARDADAHSVGRAFSGAGIEVALGSYPGFAVTTSPQPASPYYICTSEYVPSEAIFHVAVLPDRTRVPIAPATSEPTRQYESAPPPDPWPQSETRRAPLGTLLGARSGDKGGNANVGVWARSEDVYRWMFHFLTVARFRELLPETKDLPIARFAFPNLLAVNFVVEGILGQGVAACTRFDPQAKGLGEWLRSRYVDLPVDLI